MATNILWNFVSKFGYNAFTLDILLFVIFFIVMSSFLYKHRAKVKFERILFPVLYAFLYRGNFGIKWMENFAQKHKKGVIIFGYIGIFFGYVGMLFATLLIFYVLYQLIFTPSVASVAPFLPFVEVPVLGYISFTHWIITIFVIVLIHEGAHGLVSLAHGLKIKKTGFGVFAIFVPFLPAAFVEPDEEKIKKSSVKKQLSIFAAGPMANFALMIPIWLIFLLILNPIELSITEPDGISFTVLDNSSYPAYQANISSNMVFNYLDGEKIVGAENFYNSLSSYLPYSNISLSYVDEKLNTTSYEYKLTLIQNPDNASRGFLGVYGIYDKYDVKDFARPYAGIFSWFKGLLLLLFEITFSLGLINLFPAAITDGGRMFSITLDKFSKYKKLNNMIVAGFGILFMIIILFSFITYFIGNPFSLFF